MATEVGQPGRPDAAQAEDIREAVALLHLVLEQQQSRGNEQPVAGDSWIRRRIERIELLDAHRARRRISLDLALPKFTRGGVETAHVRYVRLTWLLRDNKLREFDLRDDDGKAIAVATREEGARLAELALKAHLYGLVSAHADELGVEPPPLARGVEDDIERLIYGSDVEREAAFTALVDARSDKDLASAASQRAVLMRDATLGVLLRRLVAEFILLAAVPGTDAQKRRVLKLTWIEQADERLSFRRWLWTRMAWSPVYLGFAAAQLDSACSYHFEVASPSDDIEIEWAALEVQGTCRREDDADPAHLVYALGGLPYGYGGNLDPIAILMMRARRQGYLRVMLFTCVIATALLAVGLWRLRDLTHDVESAAALLLFVPGLLSLYLVRPGEHGLATELFSGVRLMVVIAALCVLAAGMLVIVDVDSVVRARLWLSLLLISGLATLAVAWSHFCPRSKPPIRDEPVRRPSAGRARDHNGRIAAVVVVVIGLACVGLPLLAGWDELNAQRRLQSQVATAARSGDRLTLSSFAKMPWTRLYVFASGTSSAAMTRTVGEERVAAGEDRGRRLDAGVGRGTSLLVLVDRDAVAEVMSIPHGKGDWTPVAHPRPRFLTPTDVLRFTPTRRARTSSAAACPTRRR